MAERALAPSPLIFSNSGEVRTGPVKSLPYVISALGGNPVGVFESADIDLDRFVNDREQRLDYNLTTQLFCTAIRQTECPHLGILVGRRSSLDDLGPVGQLMRCAATAEEALHDLVAHSKLHDRGAAPLFFPLTGQLSLLGYVIHRHDLVTPRPLIDTAMMVGVRALRELLGPGWTPVRAQLAYRKPEDFSAYSRMFRCPVQFNANVSGLVILNQQLRQKLKTANPRRHQQLRGAIVAATAGLTTSELIRHQLHSLLLAGEARAEQIAERVGLHIRTLHRRLDAEGTHVQQLITETRRSLAMQLLAHTNLPVSTVAQSLQYQDPNAFSRAFKLWTGISPQLWRNTSSPISNSAAPLITPG
ncbi:AraC family transcriptional regulator [Pseudomonas sp. MT3]|uniref:AraC family transcriptional regulator n=1 Tax=Pseudomonas sp. ATCC 13867 TaxID=1294143 RepID=UPI0002C4DC4D|nr:AraC family transcriptional regulator [Pseudomonas sp. ATCC 13867]AGI24829.1 AraC family transcriptional regulator [Pseudomonas sp. ATCC 13867]